MGRKCIWHFIRTRNERSTQHYSKISIPDDDVRSIRTVNDVVEGVKKLLAAAPPDTSMGSATPAA